MTIRAEAREARQMQRIGFGAAQTTPRAGDVTANVRQHVLLAELASAAGANVLVFPELSLTGYEMRLARELAFTVDDARLDQLVQAARTLELILIVGAPLRLAEALHIAALVIGTDGTILPYTKQFLGAFPPSASVDGTIPPPETSVFTKGTLDPIVSVGDYNGAVAVCADANRPAHAAAASRRGANLYLTSAFVIPSGFDEASGNLNEYAKRHAMLIAFANYGASTGGMATAGQSSLWSSDGTLLGRLARSGCGVVVANNVSSGWQVETRYE